MNHACLYAYCLYKMQQIQILEQRQLMSNIKTSLYCIALHLYWVWRLRCTTHATLLSQTAFNTFHSLNLNHNKMKSNCIQWPSSYGSRSILLYNLAILWSMRLDIKFHFKCLYVSGFLPNFASNLKTAYSIYRQQWTPQHLGHIVDQGRTTLNKACWKLYGIILYDYQNYTPTLFMFRCTQPV